MLPTYQHNTQATVAVDFPFVNGVAVSPTAISYRVTDEVGSEVEASETLPVPSDASQVSVVIDAASNIVADDRLRAMRVVNFTFTAPTGVHTTVARYVVEKATLLVPLTNSFQSYEEALLTRFDLPTLDGWDMAEERSHIPALVTAHDRMCRLTYRYELGQNAVCYDRDDPWWPITNIRAATILDYGKWPSDFKTALRRAQLYEADQILKGDPVAEKRRIGVVSETIGEAKMFFNAKPPLRLALCEQAMEVLGRYTVNMRRIGRA